MHEAEDLLVGEEKVKDLALLEISDLAGIAMESLLLANDLNTFFEEGFKRAVGWIGVGDAGSVLRLLTKLLLLLLPLSQQLLHHLLQLDILQSHLPEHLIDFLEEVHKELHVIHPELINDAVLDLVEELR